MQGLYAAAPSPSAFVIGGGDGSRVSGRIDGSSGRTAAVLSTAPATPGSAMFRESPGSGASGEGPGLAAVKNSLAAAVHGMRDVLEGDEAVAAGEDGSLVLFSMIGRGSSGTVYHGVCLPPSPLPCCCLTSCLAYARCLALRTVSGCEQVSGEACKWR